MAYHSSSASSRKHNSRRPKRSGRAKQRGFSIPWLPVFGSVGVAALLLGIGYITVNDLSAAKPDELGCYLQAEGSASTTALIDSSEPGFDVVQSRDLIHAFSRIVQNDLSFNERFSMVTTQESQIGTFPPPVIQLCGSATSSEELEEIGAAGATQAFLKRQAEDMFKTRVEPRLKSVFSINPSDADRQKRESPVLEQIQNVAREYDLGDGKSTQKLILVSDLIQNTSELQFCSTQGHLPKFEMFKTQGHYDRLKPPSLRGVEVSVYMLIRGTLGSAPYNFCTEEELTQWWRDYFEDAGARNVRFIRIRRGG